MRYGACTTVTAPEPPLDVAQVLHEEYRVLYGHEEPPGTNLEALPGWLLSVDQLRDAAGFVQRLAGSSKVASYVAHQLPWSTRDELAALAAADAERLVALAPRLVDELNGLLRRNQLLFDDDTLPSVDLDQDTLALRAMTPDGDGLVHLNRLLLEQAFPGAIERIYEVRLRAVYRRIHARQRGSRGRRAGLCISGGGIRSATFALGLLQGLARLKYLDRFDYMSTVSGGGYVGAWLTSWIHRHARGTPGVQTELANVDPGSPLTPEPRPIHHLREYSNYLSPRLGLLSADAWTLAGIYLRNLVLNWTVLVPLLLGVLAVPRFVVALTLADSGPGMAGREWTMLGVGLVALLVAVVYIGLFRPSHAEARRQRRWLRRRGSQGEFLALCLAPLMLCALALTTFWAWWSDPVPLLSGWRLVGVLAALGGGLHVVAWAFHATILRRFDVRELVVSLLTGAAAGFLAGLGLWKLMPAVP
ncbi:MAG TPA: patatin-like phospholipase family protein, partial [Methylomirabilota bacterium]|nr:patatin-like phospholipase family protein [Methylomirabilota bacterium]